MASLCVKWKVFVLLLFSRCILPIFEEREMEDSPFLLSPLYLISFSSFKQNSLNQDFKSSNLKNTWLQDGKLWVVKEHEEHAFLNTKTAGKITLNWKKWSRKKSLKRENLLRRKQFGKINEPVLLTESNKQGVLCFLRLLSLKNIS